MGFEGYPFTWSNGREEEANVQLRLDRDFGTEPLLLKFPYFKVTHSSRHGSDHSPLLIELDSSSLTPSKRSRIFIFEETWTREPRCAEHIKQA